MRDGEADDKNRRKRQISSKYTEARRFNSENLVVKQRNYEGKV